MSKDEIGDADRPGRRPGIKRLTYRPRNRMKDTEGRGIGRPTLDWSSHKDQLRRTVSRIPEVVIIVDGGGRADERGKRSTTQDTQGVRKYMLYVSRNGKLPVRNEQGDILADRDDLLGNLESWNLGLQKQTGWVTHHKAGRGGRVEQLHQTFNLIFSMPSGTDPNALFDSVQVFALDHFRERQYIMVLHTPETDPAPKSKRADHPHVHVIIRAEDDHGQRLYCRKRDLAIWREDFAQQLRNRGIEANATSRAERGVSRKSIRGAEHHIMERWRSGKGDPPTALATRFEQAAAELRDGRTELKPWELAMAARRRDVQRKLEESAQRLRNEGELKLAVQVEKFMHEMPKIETERRSMQRALVDQVTRRQRDAEERSQDFPRELE